MLTSRTGFLAVASCVALAASYSSADSAGESGSTTVETSASTASTNTESTNTGTTNTAPASTTSTSAVPTLVKEPPPTDPSSIDLPMMTLESMEGQWGDHVAVGEINSLRIAGVLPDTHSLLFVEQRGAVDGGCEGGVDPLGRLVLLDLDSASSTILIDELEARDSRVALGPNGRIAIVGGCDANAWLAAVGSIGSDEPFRSSV